MLGLQRGIWYLVLGDPSNTGIEHLRFWYFRYYLVLVFGIPYILLYQHLIDEELVFYILWTLYPSKPSSANLYAPRYFPTFHKMSILVDQAAGL